MPLMTPDQEIADFNKAYADTYVKCGDTPYFIEEIIRLEENKNIIVASGHKIIKKENIWCCSLTNFSDLTLIHPICGAINLPEYAIYIKRIPRRQWKKGLYFDNINIKCYSSSELTALDHIFNIKTPINLYSWFNPIFYSPQEAYEKLLNGDMLSVAINQHLVLANHLYKKETFVYYKNYKVGTIDRGVVLLNSTISHLMDEISMYFPVELK